MSVLAAVIQTARRSQRGGFLLAFRHWGASGLFFLAILDSSPIPTFAGTDILTAILAASHRNPWHEYAGVATVGSILGAWITFRLARRAGVSYLQSKFKRRRVAALLELFRSWGAGALAISTAVPFPFPTSALFAAAGASGYSERKYLAIVTLSRAFRYSLVALLAAHYGRHFVRMIRHPDQHWGWLLLFGAMVAALAGAGVLLNKRLEAASSAA